MTSLDLTQMFKIKVSSACEITIAGIPINPAEHAITIQSGVNWIVFPLNESMSIDDAFSGFAASGDMVVSKSSYSSDTGSRWRGSFNTLEPGQGYIYKSNVTYDRTFTFGTTQKKNMK